MSVFHEKKMLKALKAGDDDAFRLFMEHHEKMVLGICLKFFPALREKEDVVQEVFIRVYEKIGSFRGQSKLSSWLYRITVNACLMRLRKESRWKRVYEELKGESWSTNSRDPQWDFQNRELMEIFQESMNRLEEKEKIAVYLRITEEKSNQETASLLGLSLPAVKSRFHRGRMKLMKGRIGRYALI